MLWNKALVQQLQSELGTLWLHDVNETMAIKRAAVAEGYGMEPGKFSRPYPGSVNITNVQAPKAGTMLKTLGIIALALGTAGLGAGLTYFLMHRAASVGNIDLEFTPLGPDGKPKVEKVN